MPLLHPSSLLPRPTPHPQSNPTHPLVCSYNELLELQLVLERAAAFFEDARSQADVARAERAAFGDGERAAESLAGVGGAGVGGREWQPAGA